jgi:predicted ArsR family transcriptional regulator
MRAEVPRAQERPRRREVLEALRNAGMPLGVAEVAGTMGVHPNTARFHLDALTAEGAVERTIEKPSGPGRPRTVYAPRPGMDRGGKRSYHLLARILLSHLASTGAGAHKAATEAGRAWGRFLIGPVAPFQQVNRKEATARLTSLLADLGFEPETDSGDTPPGRIRLRHCPFLELAEEHGELICPMHLGLMQGALAELRAPVAATKLEPFAEPAACLAHLASVDPT